ncbi:MAG TPA: DUF1579 domain-containing protein [Gemmataceae bacterium]|nr:DUF1579 domain-containing protein [Gemmataceae bacterium]
MKKIAIVGFAVAFLGTGALAQAPEPQKEQEWLKQLAGEWDYETEVTLEADKPPMKIKGTESVRTVGNSWITAELKATFADQPFTGILTVGFDAHKKKYLGTWLDSMHGHLLHYEGTLDVAAKTLTLLTEAPNPADPGKLCKFKEVLEVKSKDHKIFTTSLQGEDGKWTPMMTINYRRKK